MRTRLPAEWEPQHAILLAWPHPDSDWSSNYSAIDDCYLSIATAIARHQQVYILCADQALKHRIAQRLTPLDIPDDRIHLALIPYNDTWLRDTAPICIERGQSPKSSVLLDFAFNAWGGKYECADDAQLAERISREWFSTHASQKLPLVLEGGSIESDGAGTILTTEQCLLSPNRNPHMDRESLESALATHLGAERVIWISSGHIEGDDTDGHIDTLARFCDEFTIAYSSCPDQSDPHWSSLAALETELKALRHPNGEAYRLIPLPLPSAKTASDGARLPANYANFLIINGAVLVPAYEDPADQNAQKALAIAFPDREIVPIDCSALIHQYGSLHCMSMQVPKALSP